MAMSEQMYPDYEDENGNVVHHEATVGSRAPETERDFNLTGEGFGDNQEAGRVAVRSAFENFDPNDGPGDNRRETLESDDDQ